MKKNKSVLSILFVAFLASAYAVGCYAPPAPPEVQKPVSVNLFLKFFMLDKMYSTNRQG